MPADIYAVVSRSLSCITESIRPCFAYEYPHNMQLTQTWAMNRDSYRYCTMYGVTDEPLSAREVCMNDTNIRIHEEEARYEVLLLIILYARVL